MPDIMKNIDAKSLPKKRRKSVIMNGYPGEDPLIELSTTTEDDEDELKTTTEDDKVMPSQNLQNKGTDIGIIAVPKRNSFLAQFLRTDSENQFDYKVASQLKYPAGQSPEMLLKSYFGDLENHLFAIFGNKTTRTINVFKFFSALLDKGLRLKDPRLREMVEGLRKVQEQFSKNQEKTLDLDYDSFLGIISQNLEIVVKAFSNSFVIPEFLGFAQLVDELYYSCKKNIEGKSATYIPQLSRVNSSNWAVSVCSVDGQRHSIGDVNVPFTLQSCSKPVNYAIAVGDCKPSIFHSYVGMEPSGRCFNDLSLDHNNKPHNPMINAGAIMTAALIKPEEMPADRFDYIFNKYKRLCGGEYLGFNNAVFLSERECADRNFALAYFMRENKCFPPGAKISEILDFYFQLCSLEITAESGAVIAATLANGGINPLTGEAILSVEAVRNTLTLMHSCGMYNYSGQFAFKVGLPAKSGVSGCILLVVPNTLGICLWSPNLDVNGNSCRGVQFCNELVDRFKFHHFDNLRSHIGGDKLDPRVSKHETEGQVMFDLLFAVAAGDISSLKRHAMTGTNLNASDYDGRTALHISAAEGHYDILEFLLDVCAADPVPKDRWGRTPLDDAKHFGHYSCAMLIESTLNRLQVENDMKCIDLVHSVDTEELRKSNVLLGNLDHQEDFDNLKISKIIPQVVINLETVEHVRDESAINGIA